ncbi:GNAT family N-acetyltransferase [Streptomyces sp. NBC_00691]|uniref:GNAT family N-acetyltransferase n=1 Tax=Streptomyces sp. NBC_00691 TaxID=2903671 RepID=UPI003251C520
MTLDPLLLRARGLWETLAGAPVSFASSGGPAGPDVVVSPASALCPGSWAGIVVLGDAAIATAPTEDVARVLRTAFSPLLPASLTRPETVRAALPVPVADVLGPATLAYLSGADFRPARADDCASGRVDSLGCDHPDFQGLLRSADPEDVAESGMEEITSPAFVVREGTDVVAAAGYRAWPFGTAHICVLTHPRWRGRRLARHTGYAAVAHALTAGRLPQWRARPPASRRVARSLGFRELGSQLSVRFEVGGLGDASRG